MGHPQRGLNLGLDSELLDAVVAESSARPQHERFAATRWEVQETFAAVCRLLQAVPAGISEQTEKAWPVRPAELERGMFEVGMPDGTWLPVRALTDEHARRLAAHDWSERDEEISLVAAE